MENSILLTVIAMLVGMMTLLLFAYRRINGQLPGLQYWVAAYVVGFLFCLAVLARLDRAEWLWVALTVTLSVLMPYLSLLGCISYVGRR
ncbi:MAG: hypothetical protein RJA34_608, partial [Pseudomonadota bacterium]